MSEQPVYLDTIQRQIVVDVITEHCKLRSWHLHAVDCRSNHCHLVVTAVDHDGEVVRDQLKGWGTRKLKDHQRLLGIEQSQIREHWWSRKGSVRYLFDDDSLEAATLYTLEAQDKGGSKRSK